MWIIPEPASVLWTEAPSSWVARAGLSWSMLAQQRLYRQLFYSWQGREERAGWRPPAWRPDRGWCPPLWGRLRRSGRSSWPARGRPEAAAGYRSSQLLPRQVHKRYTHKTSGFKTSGFKTSGFKTSETSGLQNVRFTKRQVYKMSGLQNVRSSKRPLQKNIHINILYLWLVEIRRFCCSHVCRQSDGCVLFSILEGFFCHISP